MGRQLYGVANRTYEKAVTFAEKYGVKKVFPTYESVFDDPEVDVVYITTPHNTHYPYMKAALEHGKHLFVEKSITLNSRELSEMRALAEEKGLVLAEAMTIWHMPLYKKLWKIVDSGRLGKVQIITMNFGSFKEYDMNNRFFNMHLAGGAMLDIGVYALSVARLFMASHPDEVVSLANRAATGVDETSGFVTRNAEGQLGVFSLSLHSKQPKRAMISFDNCYLEINDYPRADRAEIVWTSDGHREIVEEGEEAYALAYEMADLEAAVAGDESKLKLIDYAADVMDTMTRLRYDWGVYYPEEAELAQAAGVAVAGE